jgi:hypothetical protein
VTLLLLLHTNTAATTALAGTLRAPQARLIATSLRLLYKATPIRAEARLRAATLTQKVAVQGRVRAGGPRLQAAVLTQKVALRGTLRAEARLVGLLGLATAKTSLVGTLRAGARIRAALLTQKVACQGRLRVGPRLRAAVLTQKVAVAGLLRVSARLRAALLTGKVALQGRIRVSPRLRAALLTQKVALQGRVRVYARLLGTIHMAGGPVTQLAGRVRQLSGRLRATEIRLLYSAAPVRIQPRLRGQLRKVWLQGLLRSATPRLRGALSGVGTGGTSELRGMLRAIGGRLEGLELTTAFSAAECRGTAPRLRAEIGFVGIIVAPLRGTVRVSGARVRPGLLRQTVPLVGAVRQSPARLTGIPGWLAITYLAGVVRQACAALRGALLRQGLPLPRATLRAGAVLRGARLTQQVPLAGQCRLSPPRLIGQVRTNRPALRGTLRVVTRIFAQARTRVAIAGVIRGIVPRAQGRMGPDYRGNVAIFGESILTTPGTRRARLTIPAEDEGSLTAADGPLTFFASS